jgi:AraC-like DNA-binding protein
MRAVKQTFDLSINECRIAPGGEWQDAEPAWKIALATSGAFYWLSGQGAQEVNAGDVLVLQPGTGGVVRASQIGPGLLHFFYFRPDRLSGLMPIVERLPLERLVATAQARKIPKTDPVAKELGDIVSRNARRRTFFTRCRMLNLIAMIFGDALPPAPPQAAGVTGTQQRFDEVVSGISDAELMDYSSERLAEMCGCSVRHFRRVFRQRFNTSIRAKQTELRLERAQQLLAETGEKIVSIAIECGYRHLGLFNSMFKRRFGMTPSEWRRQNSARAARPEAQGMALR